MNSELFDGTEMREFKLLGCLILLVTAELTFQNVSIHCYKQNKLRFVFWPNVYKTYIEQRNLHLLREKEKACELLRENRSESSRD